LQRQITGVPDPDSLRRLISKGGIQSPPVKAGSVLIFDCNTIHGSNSNISPYPRSNIFFVYNSMENSLTRPFCGLPPRPEYLASRNGVRALRPTLLFSSGVAQ
jgi:ectoine hydroxylase